MPDPDQPINPTQTTDPSAPVMPVVEEITIPTLNTTPTDAPPPPPPPPGPAEASSAPPPDLPPVVPPVITPPPAKKFGGRRVIATILGLLVLGGGLTAGLILVRQQQLFRQKAQEGCYDENGLPVSCPEETPPPQERACTASDCGCEAGFRCVGTTPNCSCEAEHTPYCAESLNCQYGCDPSPQGGFCKPKPEQATSYCSDFNYRDCAYGCEPTPDGGKCKEPPSSTPLPTDIPSCATRYCDRSSPNTGDCTDKGPGASCTREPKYGGGSGTCKIIIPGGCSPYGANSECECYVPPSQTPGPTPKPGGGPPGPGPTLPPGVSAQCLNIQAFDTNWTQITNLSTIKAGDKVRFTVTGDPATQIDKARFTINGVLRPEVTQKKPVTGEYFDEYTIPQGTSSFSVNAQLHHSTLGWF